MIELLNIIPKTIPIPYQLVPFYNISDYNSVITNIDYKVSSSQDSYITGKYNNIQITSYGYYGGVQPNRTLNYPAWCVFNTEVYNIGENLNQMLHKFFCPGNETYKSTGPVTIELKFLDKIKRTYTSCEINYGNTNSGQTKYYHKSIEFKVGNDSIYTASNLELLPKNTSRTYIFDSNKCSDTFKITFTEPVNGGYLINWIKVFGYSEID